MTKILPRITKITLSRAQILFWLILLFGIVLRVWLLGAVPSGLNQDEASMGYDAWAILHYGIDRNGTALPLHMISWGSGQNALYAYLSMPFIALFGLNEMSIRMVSALLNCLTLPVCYLILKRFSSTRTALIGMALLCIAPGHIILSRWGLESNILPAVFTFAVYFLTKALDKPWYFVPSSLLFALSLYAYGTAYCVVPIFFFGVLIAFAWKVKPGKWPLIAGTACFVLVAVPIGLFVLTNMFKWGDIQIGPFTVPQTTSEDVRFSSVMSGGNIDEQLKNFFENVILQSDGTGRNILQPYGIYYLISFPFTLLGLGKIWGRRSPLTYILSGWIGVSLLLFILISGTNINRVNIIYIPLILLTAFGLEDVMRRNWRRTFAMAAAYYLLFTGFAVEYVNRYAVEESVHGFYAGFGDAIRKADEAAGEQKNIYVTTTVNMPYIFVLFYTQTPPQEFLETREIKDMNDEFQWVNSFGRFVFDTGGLETAEPGVYIIPSYHEEQYSDRSSEVYSLDKYSVLVVSEENSSEKEGITINESEGNP